MELKLIEERLCRIEDFLFSQKSVLTMDEVSRFTGKSKSHLYKLTCTRGIPFYKRGKHLYFDRQEIEEWLKENRYKTKKEIEEEASSYLVKKGGKS